MVHLFTTQILLMEFNAFPMPIPRIDFRSQGQLVTWGTTHAQWHNGKNLKLVNLSSVEPLYRIPRRTHN